MSNAITPERARRNKERAESVRPLVDLFTGNRTQEAADVQDIIVNLMHFADRAFPDEANKDAGDATTGETVHRMAMGNYQAERYGDDIEDAQDDDDRSGRRAAVLVWSTETSCAAMALLDADISALMPGYENLKRNSLAMFHEGTDIAKRNDPFTPTDPMNVYMLYAYVNEDNPTTVAVEEDVLMNLDIMLPNALIRFLTIPENY